MKSNENYGSHVEKMGMIAPLTPKESKILAELHTLKIYKKTRLSINKLPSLRLFVT